MMRMRSSLLPPPPVARLAAVLLALSVGASLSAAQTATPTRARAAADSVAMAKARADSARYPYTAADVQFMDGMIGHHAQAVTMSRMAPTHGASPAVRRLAERIINAQQDEIATMQRWLRDRGQPVPDVSTPEKAMAGMHMSGMSMPGMAMPGAAHDSAHGAGQAMSAGHAMMMPGMLTPAQMAELDRERGKEFDRLFLTGMIQHHKGAVRMVDELFGTYGAAQDELVFKFASDVHVDQTTEIARMQQLLADVVLGTS